MMVEVWLPKRTYYALLTLLTDIPVPSRSMDPWELQNFMRAMEEAHPALGEYARRTMAS